jgi:diaminohydroxyphosphoribosylaminopyrimidine deaminase/5-amino-6-(5-phosphoribosylamino)uracil reductase
MHFLYAPVFHLTGGRRVKNDTHSTLLLQRAMLRANQLAIQGLGRTSPNPIVGAVILNDQGKEVASGFHIGGDHAEVIAINNAKSHGYDDFSSATLVVTLEPCNHHGKTPPCVEAIIKSGFRKVVFAVKDPNPIAQGGAQALKNAGIDVVGGVESEYISYSNRAWLKKVNTGKPWVVTKIAATIDGKIAAFDGTSKWITSAESRADVAHLRNRVDAIVTTTQTVLSDDAELTPRFEGKNPTGRMKNPVRVVLGQREIPSDCAINNDRAETRFIKSRIFSEVLAFASAEGWNEVLIEAGATLNSALISEGLIDEIVLYQAPSLLGKGKSFVEDLNISTLTDRIDFSYGETTRIGSDLRIQLLTRNSGYAEIFKVPQLQAGVR